MPKQIQAILFDMDGVLVNAKMWHYNALNQSLEHFGYKPISQEDHIAYYDGLPTRQKLLMLAERQSIPAAQFEAINALKQSYTTEIARRECRPVQQHIDTLSRLRDDGYRIAVCSNSIRASLDLLMTKAELLGFFEFTLSSQDVKNPKPDPEIYSKAMQKMNIKPSNTLILEDSAYGIQAARASGGRVMEIDDIMKVEYSFIIENIERIESANDR